SCHPKDDSVVILWITILVIIVPRFDGEFFWIGRFDCEVSCFQCFGHYRKQFFGVTARNSDEWSRNFKWAIVDLRCRLRCVGVASQGRKLKWTPKFGQ